jgi:hypothetical protein
LLGVETESGGLKKILSLTILLTLILGAPSHGASVKKTVTDHFDIVRPWTYKKRENFYAANIGLSDYIRQVYRTDSTLKARAQVFYGDYFRIVGSRNFDLIEFDSVAGQGDYTDLAPGWLWKLALDHADQDPQTAMRLIALCGHDDIEQGGPLDWVAEDLQLRCPNQNTLFYLPKNLDAKADISDALKRRISRIKHHDIYAPLRSKYYHVFGAAFVACEAISRGDSPRFEVFAAREMGLLYRLIVLPETNGWLPPPRQAKMEIDWTEAQHVAGAKFAQQVCPPKQN